jgi:hydrogenase-4 transcriptional activator
MKKFKEILLKVWREACRQIVITESSASIAQLLTDHMPLEQLKVQRIDYDYSTVETVALGLPESEKSHTNASITLTPHQMENLLSWCEQEKISRRLIVPLKSIFPEPVECGILVGPLIKEKKILGILSFFSTPGTVFESRHFEMAKILLEPFAVALENDFRLREITTLREAAEADKRSLLTKLSRKSMDDNEIIGAEGGLRSVMKRVYLVARSNVPVMIFGETGTGKELISREIHRHSPCASGPFIRVNCGAIPQELIDSQLFGHERGAFTGAVESRKGWFERANDGTLFLDEIGELSLAAQVRLLRVLQDGWLEPIGAKRSIHVDVRVIVATHRDLAEMVAEGKFREDLWYRLAVFPIFLPPLRDRKDDIPEMAKHFSRRAAIRFGLTPRMPGEEDIRLLCDYPWPGNVRELASVINRAAILGDGKGLEIKKALGWLNPDNVQPENKYQNQQDINENGYESLDEAMKRHIENALKITSGRIEGNRGAAELLKINPHTLRARMRKLGVNWQKYRIQ